MKGLNMVLTRRELEQLKDSIATISYYKAKQAEYDSSIAFLDAHNEEYAIALGMILSKDNLNTIKTLIDMLDDNKGDLK